MNTPKRSAEEALSAGKTLRINPEGTSMLPLIKAGRDSIYINGVFFEDVKKGDIILYRDEYHRLILHRLVKKTPTAFYTVGDNQLVAAGPYKKEALLGKMVGMNRKGKFLDSRQTSMRLYSSIWMVRRRLLLIARTIVRGKSPSKK